MHLLALGTAVAVVALPPVSPPGRDAATTVAVQETRIREALSIGVDTGRSGGQGILAPAVSLLRLHERSEGIARRGLDGKLRGGLGATVWLGYGGEFRLLAPQEGPVGGQVSGKAKVSVLGDAGGTSFEATVGGARLPGGALRATGSLGAALSFLYADIGYAYQIPLDGGPRPFGLAAHQFTLRITLPVANGPTTRVERSAPGPVLAVSSPPSAVPGGQACASVLAVSSPPSAVPGGQARASVLAVSSPPSAVPGGQACASVLAVSSPPSAVPGGQARGQEPTAGR